MKKRNNSINRNTITINRKAKHDYSLGERFEAGVQLLGWEVKSLRAGQVQLRDSHVIIKQGEAFLMGSHITPMANTARHSQLDPNRTRKLLLHRAELSKLHGLVKRKQYTIVPLALYWKNNNAKLEIALAVGKKAHDKRAAMRENEWHRQHQRMVRREMQR